MSDPKQANILLDSALEIERQIMQYCTLKQDEINDVTVSTYINKLKQYEIKPKENEIEER